MLYRYCRQNDLATAVMRNHGILRILNMIAALSADMDGFEPTCEIIRVYVETGGPTGAVSSVMANTKVIADWRNHCPHARVTLRRRMLAGMDTAESSRKHGSWAACSWPPTPGCQTRA